jgi:transcriptional regulator with XRE-family HTH domain
VPEPLEILTANLKAARIARGLSQEAAADAAGMDQSQWWKIESGQVDPSVKTLARVAAAVGVSVSDLLHGA